MARAVLLLGALGFISSTLGQPAIPPKELSHLKDATIYIRSVEQGHPVSGSGWLFERKDGVGLVVTNAHVVRSVSDIKVVLASGRPEERTLKAELVAKDDEVDLAVLRIKDDKLPEPINSFRATNLTETMPVFVIGFPFGEAIAARKGNPEVTLSPTFISSFRRNDRGQLVTLQLSGGINPGNSGGPVVDSRGYLVGVAVAMVGNAQLGLAIPVHQFKDMLLGKVGQVSFSQRLREPGKVQCDVHVELVDPLGVLQYVSVLVAPRSPDNERIIIAPDGTYTALKIAHESKLEMKGRVATVQLNIQLKPGEELNHLVQVKYVRRDRNIAYTKPIDLGGALREQVIGKNELLAAAVAEPEIEVPIQKPADAPPPLKDTATVLPGALESVCPAGAGRYLVCKVKDLPALVVFDSYEAKVARTIRLPSTDFLFGAGGDRALVYLKDENIFQSLNITNGEKVKTKPNPFSSPIEFIVMGHARGDMALVGPTKSPAHSDSNSPNLFFVTLATLGSTPVPTKSMVYWDSSRSRTPVTSNHDLSRVIISGRLLSRTGTGYEIAAKASETPPIIAGDDGRVYAAQGRILSHELLQVGSIPDSVLSPGLGGGFVLGVNVAGQISIYESGKSVPVTTWGQFPNWQAITKGVRDDSHQPLSVFRPEQRIIFAPACGRCMFIPPENDTIVVREFELKKVLDASGIDYLVVKSVPQTEVKAREEWKYQMEVLSKAGGVTYSLEFGPTSMKITDTGLISWTAPLAMTEQGERVVVLVKDQSGEQVYHTFTLRMPLRPSVPPQVPAR